MRKKRRRRNPPPSGPRFSPVLVADPEAPGRQVMAARSRDDPLWELWCRRQIEQPMFDAGRKWQEDWELATAGAVRALDPTRDIVDQSGVGEVFSDARLSALARLRQAHTVLGVEGNALVQLVLGSGMTVRELCGGLGDFETRFWGRYFRQCLTTLARHYHLIPPS